jgi:hypothetical protein
VSVANLPLQYCYFPLSTSSGSEDFYLDGCSIAAQSVPGGTIANYNLYVMSWTFEYIYANC